MWRRCPYRLRSGTRPLGLRNLEVVDRYKAKMLAGEWDFAERGATFVFWQEGRTVWVSEGHHRANAALEIGREMNDWTFLERLLQNGRREPGLLPMANRGRFPTRSWFSRWLTFLGW